MTENSANFDKSVIHIQQKIISEQDAALLEFTRKFDRLTVPEFEFKVSKKEIELAYTQVSKTLISALKKAKANITRYHRYQKPKSWTKKPKNGIELGLRYTPIERVGIYVPGGRAAYPSTVLMNAIPAIIAGVDDVIMVTPPQPDGTIAPSVLVAADLCGVTHIYKIGGAQAVFALAYGTQTIPKVDKIVGPGNAYVTRAKELVYGIVDIDKPAGPSEVLVYCEDPKYATYAAAEMLAQLEHDPLASAITVSTRQDTLDAIQTALDIQITECQRQSVLLKSIANRSLVLAKTQSDALRLINEIASEHLVLLVDNPKDLLPDIRHAGAIFMGPYTPVTLGDYVAGPNHVLPTSKAARYASPLTVMDFMKSTSLITYSKPALQSIAATLKTLTDAEGFDAHYLAVETRL
jgi:histidinol dehydrogenase